MPAPVLKDIVRQHAEMAAFLWMVYDRAMLHPEENPEMDEVRIARVVERLEAHLEGLRVAGDEGVAMARERYAEFREAGELFVVRMLEPGADKVRVAELDLIRARTYLAMSLK